MSQKFLFDENFGDADGSWSERRRRSKPETYTAEDLHTARLEGFAEGKAEGRRAATGEIEATAAAALDRLASGLDACRAELDLVLSAQARDAAEIAVEIGRRLAQELLAAQPLSEIEALVTHCLGELRDEPRLVVRTSEPVAEALRDRVDDLARRSGFEGRVVLLPDDALGPQDCRIEWADGGAVRELEAIEAEIADAVRRFTNAKDSTLGRME